MTATAEPDHSPKTARRPVATYDPRTHVAMDTGWQTLTLCGKRVTWLNGREEIDPGTGVVDCTECIEAKGSA